MHWQREYDFSLDTPFQDYPKKIHDILIYGTNGKKVKVHYTGQRGTGVYDVAFDGLIKNVERRYRETSSDATKQEYETFMRVTPCQACHGQRLKPTSLAVTVGDKKHCGGYRSFHRKAHAVSERADIDRAADADRKAGA